MTPMKLIINLSAVLRKIAALVFFSAYSACLIYGWFYLTLINDESISLTMISSSFTSICIVLSCMLILCQKREQNLTLYFIKITSVISLLFFLTVTVFNIYHGCFPNLVDIMFYYECYLILFFEITPISLIFRFYSHCDNSEGC